MFDARHRGRGENGGGKGVERGIERLWSRDSEVANEISRGGHVLGMIVVGAR